MFLTLQHILTREMTCIRTPDATTLNDWHRLTVQHQEMLMQWKKNPITDFGITFLQTVRMATANAVLFRVAWGYVRGWFV